MPLQKRDEHYRRTLTPPWGNEDTQKLIDILARYNIKTTFFVVGDWVEKYPESVMALHEAGHEVMSHSAHHDHYNQLSADQIVADVTASCDAIEKVCGVRPTLLRPPYGEYDDHVIAAIRSLGIEPIQWDVDRVQREESPVFMRVSGIQIEDFSGIKLIRCRMIQNH